MGRLARSWKTFPIAIAGAAFLASVVLFGAMALLIPVTEATPLVIVWCLLWAAAVGVAASRGAFDTGIEQIRTALEVRLRDREWVAGPLSIADFMIWPWMTLYKGQGQDIDQFPHVRAWLDRCKARPAFSKGREAGADLSKTSIADNSKEAEEARKILFGQKARI